MTKERLISDGIRRSKQGIGGSWRPGLWGLAAWLRHGGIAVAFCVAMRTNTAGALALVAFIGGFLLRQVLEATSQGD